MAAVVHIYYPEVADELCSYLGNLRSPSGIFVSTDTELKRSAIEDAFRRWQIAPVDIRVMPNRGRDIAPKLIGFADVYDRHEYVVHLHTKKVFTLKQAIPGEHSFTNICSDRRPLSRVLLGALSGIRGWAWCFRSTGHRWLKWIHWGGNLPLAQSLARRMHVNLPDGLVPDFPSGSMFWARSAALRPLYRPHELVTDAGSQGKLVSERSRPGSSRSAFQAAQAASTTAS